MVTSLSDLLRDKSVLKQENFEKIDQSKTTGQSAGYIAREKASGNIFLLKSFKKNIKEAYTAQEIQDRVDAVRELIASDLYKVILFDNTPRIQLVKGDEDHKDFLYVRSKFLTSDNNDVQNLDDVLKPNTEAVNISGLEKAIASCHILGDIDYHGKNLMVRESLIAKIDHGKSFSAFYENTPTLIKSIKNRFNKYGFINAINNGTLTFNVDIYSESLNHMLNTITPDLIDKIVDQRMAELKEAGFSPDKFEIEQGNKVNSFEELGQEYKNILNRHITNMGKIAESISVISKYSNVEEQFKNKDWFQKITEDPVIFAANNNILIEGENPLLWAYKNKYLVKTIEDEEEVKVTNTKEFWEKIKLENGKKSSKWEKETVSVTDNIIQDIYENIEPIEKIIKNLPKLNNEQKEYASYFINDFINYANNNNLVNSKGGKYDKLIAKYNLEPILNNLDKQKSTSQTSIDSGLGESYSAEINQIKKTLEQYSFSNSQRASTSISSSTKNKSNQFSR